MSAIASQIIGLSIVHLTVRLDRSKKTSKPCVTGLWTGNLPVPMNSLHKGAVMRKIYSFDDVIMFTNQSSLITYEIRYKYDIGEI